MPEGVPSATLSPLPTGSTGAGVGDGVCDGVTEGDAPGESDAVGVGVGEELTVLLPVQLIVVLTVPLTVALGEGVGLPVDELLMLAATHASTRALPALPTDVNGEEPTNVTALVRDAPHVAFTKDEPPPPGA